MAVASTIERDEEVIQILEELDSNFSAIKNTLRDIKMKVGKFSQSNRRLLSDMRPWIKFFEMEQQHPPEVSPLSDLHIANIKFRELGGSPDVMVAAVPRNPFIEQDSSDLLNKSILRDFKSSTVLDSSSVAVLPHGAQHAGDAEHEHAVDSEDCDGEVVPFSLSKIPEIFHREESLKELYDFIAENGRVSIEEICKRFEELQPEKLEIFVSLLCRKKFIRQKSNYLTI